MNIYLAHLRVAGDLARKSLIPQIYFAVFVLAAWWVVNEFQWIPRNLLPSPLLVIGDLYRNIHHYWSQLSQTLLAAAYGLLAASLAATVLALLGSMWRPLLDVLSSVSVLSQTAPVIALAPVLAFIFGFSLWTQSAVAFLVALFPIGNACVRAVAYCPQETQNLASAMRLDGLDRVRWIDGPRIVEALFTSFALSAVLAFIGSLVYEFVSPDRGVGMVIVMSQRNYEEVPLFSGVLMALLAGVSIFGFFELVYIVYRIYRRDLSQTATARLFQGD